MNFLHLDLISAIETSNGNRSILDFMVRATNTFINVISRLSTLNTFTKHSKVFFHLHNGVFGRGINN